ncbi:G protein-coupled receptor [Capsaspora owczarzaki ATCC 30864]|uniref:G protein-coupled receptor n=1 Tax=Capsaspora owczarzaki (strain ATCC 30864) TaxID=595528 RepID=A0A0D2VQ40_CAPO3|nr:G protein-coupled receptor [Capsaspora owczarzaki ATCC 30864]
MTGAQLERGGSPTKAPPRLTAHPRGSRLLTLRAAFSSVLLLLLGFLAISAVAQPIFLDSISYTTLTTDCNYLDQYFYGTQLIHKSRLDICGNTFTETLFYHTECYGAPVFSLKTSGYIYQTGFELDAGNFQLALSSLTVNASSAAGLRAVQDYCNVSSGYKQVVDVSTTGCPGLGIAPLSDCPMRFVSISSYDVATVSHLLLSAEPFVLASCSLPYTSSSVHGREAYTSNYDVCPYPSDGPFNVFKSMASLKYATEGDAVSATIRRWSGPVDIPFEINCTVSEEETTAAPGDYVVLSSLVLSFGSGVLSQDVSVSFPQNAAPAMTRKLVLECASSAATVHAASGSSERIEIVLFDDDTDLFSFATPSVNSYPDRAGSVLVERTPASPESGTVQYYFVLDDIAPEDFSDSFPLSGEIEFGPGQESFLFELPMPAYNFDAHAPYIYSMHLNASANSVGTHSVLEVSVGGAYDPGTPYFQNVDHPLVLGETIYISSSFDSEFSFFQPFTCKWRLSDDSWTGAPASETFEVVSGIFSWEYSYSSPAVTLVVLPAETTLSKHFQLVPFDCLGSSVSDGSDGVQVAIQYQGLVPSIRLLADNYQASVWEGSIQVNVALSSALEEDATFPWEIVPDTAVADEDYSPANGLILFSAGSTEATVEITLPPNSSPSYGKSFTFRLMTEDPSFAVVAIDLPNAMLVEIYAHDNPDGEFTFSNVTAQTIPEGQSWSVELVRSVNWTLPVEIVLDDHFHERRKDSTSASTTRSNRGPRSTRNVPQPGRASRPNGELEPTLGRKASLRTRRDRDVVEEDARLQLSPNPVVFLPGETTKTITITALDDDRPEWDEYYPVYMQTFSIDTVGAAASPEQEILVLVPENDDPHGTFTIEQGVSTPVGTFLAINLHRDGQMPSNGVGYNVYYEIIPMTALPGVDYLVPENNYTVFDGNVWSLDTSIQIQILDTGLPAQDKFFEVRLLSIECPCVNPVIFPHISQVANSTVVRIEAQNGANGHFAFDDFSPRAINVTEGGVSLTVVRTDALYGACNLTISSTGQASLGYDFTSDPIQFVDGQATSTLYLQFIPQMDPVITRTAEVYLSGSCSGATLDSTPVTIIFPVANNPFGVFQIEQRDYPFETFGSYDIAVTRAWTSLGAVQINYEIFDSEGESPSDIQDNSGGSITMEPYQSYAYISFQYVDVSASQPRRTFFVNITSITKTDDPDPEPLSAPVIGVGLGQYWLAPTGTAGGDFVLQQISPLDLVKGGPPQPFRVDRLNSASGNVTVYLYFYSPVPFILTDQLLFVDGETTKTGYIQAVDDGRDSNAVAESLSIDHIDGIATSYTSDTLNVTIARDGFPGGTFFIAPVSQNMTVDRLAPVDLLILRAGDRAGEVKVWLNVVGTGDEHTAAFDTDYTLAPNPVTLAPFQAAGVVTLSWPISESPMPYQNIQLGIVSLTSADSELSPTYLESATAMLTVLPDEYANGLFAFDLEFVSQSVSSSGDVTFTIFRSVSTVGAVYVTILPEADSEFPEPAVFGEDVIGPENPIIVTFADGQQVGEFTVTAVMDSTPQVAKRILFRIANVTSADGLLINAGIDSDVYQATLDLEAHDYPHGVFGFLDAIVHVDPFNSTILTLTIKRDGGSIGGVRARVSTATATFGELADPNTDFVSVDGMLVEFADGQTEAQAQITLLENPEPHPDLNFLVVIDDVTLKPALPFSGAVPELNETASSVQVVIRYHDLESGTFQFSVTSASVNTGSGFWLDIDRIGEDNGDVVLQITPDLLSEQYPLDLTNNLPSFLAPMTVSFADAQLKQSIYLSTLSSIAPSVDSSVSLILTVLSHQYDNAAIGPEGTMVAVRLERFGGLIGAVTASFTVSFDGASAADIQVSPATSVTFADGESEQFINVTIVDDHIPEELEVLQITISDLVVDLESTGATPHYGQLSSQITIPDNDQGEYGTVFFASELVLAEEGASAVVTVTRVNGSYGAVAVALSASGNAESPSDYTLSSYLVSFADGEVSQNVTIDIIADGIPELQESIYLELQDPEGGVAIGSPSSMEVRIAANDNAYGTISFAADSETVTVVASETDSVQVTLNVTRTGGTIGKVRVRYSTVSGGVAGVGPASSGVDYTAITSNEFVMLAGASTAQITVTILANNLPTLDVGFLVFIEHVEIEEDVIIVFRRGNDKPDIGSRNASAITIAAHNDPNGVFEFATTGAIVQSTSGTYTLIVRRTGGTIGTASLSATASVSGQQYPIDLVQDASLASPLAVSFGDGSSQASAIITIVNNGLPRVTSTAVITLSIGSAGAYGRLGTNTTFTLTIPAHNNPHGIVSFGATSQSVSLVSSTSSAVTVQLNVTRTGGSIGALTVLYNTVSGGVSGVASATAGTDYVAVASGSLSLADGVSSGSIVITLPANSIPTLDVGFQVLLSSVSLTSLIGTGAVPTLGSGAAAQGNITIAAHNDPNGVFEFATTGAIVQSTSESYTLVVRRTGGTIGTASLSATASVSGQQYPIDLVLDASLASPLSVTFGDGSSQASTFITILNNGLPRVTSTAVITLSIGSAGAYARLGTNTTFTLTIPAHNNPHGAVSFAAGSQALTVAPLAGAASSIQLNLTRTGGSIGTLVVTYQTSAGGVAGIEAATAGEDFTPIVAATVTIPAGSASAFVMVTIPSNVAPELDRGFQVLLTNVAVSDLTNTGATPSLGSGAASMSNVTLSAQNDPNGVFEFAVTSVVADSTSGSYLLVVHRSAGTVGAAVLTGTASVSGQQYPLDLEQDVSLTTPLVFNFADGATTASASIVIVNNGQPRVSSTAVLTLAITSAGSYARLGDNTTVLFTIPAHNNPHGTVSFGATSQSVSVASSTSSAVTVQLNVTRTGGSIGALTVLYNTVSGGVSGVTSATAGTDYVAVASGSLSLADGVSSGSIVITLPANSIPTLDVGFRVLLSSVSLTSLVGTGAVPTLGLGAAAQGNITIAAHNDPNGVFEFATTGAIVQSTSGTYTLIVRRTGGTIGTASLSATASVSGQQYPIDLVQDASLASPLAVSFGDGSSQASAIITIVNNGLPRVTSTAVITLSIGSAGAYGRLGTNTTFTLTIPAHNNPHGIVSFGATSQSVSVVSSTSSAVTVQLNVTRTGGSIGALTVLYNTVSGGVSGVASATAGTDYVAVPSGSLSLADGVSSGSIVITLPANSIPTLDVGFQVLLSSVSLTSLIGTGAVPTLGSGAAAQGNITIAAHNDPNGVFEFATTGAIVQSTSESYTLVVRRTGGTIGTASLSATASVSGQQYPIDLVLDASLASPLSVTFGDGSSQASTFITILNNGLPRVTSTAVITLSIGSAGAYARLGTNTTFTLTIPAHDNPFGTVSFSSDSQALSLQQSAFLLTLNITRQGGTFGDIDLVFSTRNPTNAGLLPAVPSVDYQPLSSVTLRLVSGQSRSFVSVMILADTTPSFDEAFEVVLVSVSTPSQSAGAVPSVGVNNVALVTLLSHHYPSGVFAVATPNLFGIQSGESIPASFVQQVQSGSVVVVVQRGAGALDEAVVSWTLSPPSSRLSPTSGALVFAAGQREAQAVLSIVASPVPAVSSTIDFSIFSVTPAVTSLLNTSAALSRVVIVGNGDPFGVFTPQDARVTVATGAQTVTVVINRSQGALEPIEVRYSTAVIPNVDRREIALRPALADVDFVPVTNQKLTFAAGQTSASVQIALLGSSRPHLALGFKVVLVSAQRVGELSSTVPTPGGMLSSWDSLTSPRISADPATMVVIPASNAPTGSFVFDTSSTSVQVSNTSSSVSVRVSRLGGSTGSVTLGVNASSFDARPSVDFKLITTTLTFAAGDTSANATISILAAAFPKAAQTITLKLSVLTTMVDGSVVVLPDPVALLGSPSTSLLLLSQYGRPGVCESQTVGNYSWPETLAGGSAIVPCEFGFVGNASRQCLSGQLALWATADVSGCRDVQSLLSDLLSVPVTEDSLQLLAENANTMSTQVGALDEGALGSLATLLSEMSAVGASAGWPGQSSYNMMSVFDNLLGSSSAGLAAYQGGNSGANNLANVLTNFGYSLLGPSPTAGTTVTRSGENAIISASAVSVGSDANFTTSSGGNFSLPGSLFDMLNGQEVQGLFAVSFALYQTSDLFPAVNQTNSAVSNVISASVQGREVYNLTEPVTFVISHAPLPTPPTCTFYNFATQQWDAEGCVTSRLSSTSTQCQCYHLTNFALFFSLGDDEIDSISADILSNITYIGCALSIFGTVVTFMTFVLLKTLRTFAMKLVMHLCVAVFGINVVFLAGATQTGNQDQCKATGIFLHFFLLCSFCWMLSLGVNLYLGIVRLNTDTYIYYKHMLIASYGVPTLIVVITMAVDIDNYGGTEACWIQDQNALIGAFYVPVLLVIAANIFMFIKIVIAFQRAAKDRRILGAEERNNLRVLVTIFLMLGITWVFGVLAIDSATTALQYLFVIFNSFQGFFIFVFYCLNQRVLQAYRATLGGRFPFSYISSLAARTSQTSAGSSSAATAASSVGERPASSTSSYFSSLPTTSKEAGYASGTFSSTTDSMHDGGESGTQSHSSGGRGSKEARRVATLPGSATGTALDNSFVRQSEAAFTGLRRQLDADRAASPSRLPASLPTTAHPSTAIEMQQIVAPRPVAVQPAVSTRPARTLSPRDLKRLDTIDFSNV